MIGWRTLCAAAVAASIAPAANAAEPEAARFTYVGYMGGVKVGTATADVAVADGKYGIDLKMNTGGFVGWFVEWRHGSSAKGDARKIGDAPLAPAAYRNESFWKEKDRVIEVGFPDGRAKIEKATPHPVTDEGRPAVPEAKLQNVVDPLTAIVGLGQMIEETGSCETTFGVFDGRRLYQLKVKDKGMVDVGQSRYAPFGGESRRCDFTFERVAGFKKKNADEPTVGRAYFRRAIDGAPVMPVRVSADSKYGGAILHLRQAEVIAPDLAEQAALPDADKASPQ